MLGHMPRSRGEMVFSLGHAGKKAPWNPIKVPRGIILFVFFAWVCGFLLIISFISSRIGDLQNFPFSQDLHVSSLEFEPFDRPLDVVVAYYTADPRILGSLPLGSILEIPVINESRPVWYLYNKSPAPPPLFLNVKIHHVINMPNVGREGHTFLYHIVHNYHNLSRQTIFCQENPDNKSNVLFRLENYYVKTTGFMALSDEMRCTCDGCSGTLKRIRDFYAIFTQELCKGDFTASLHGCFVVSRRRIHSLKLERYQYLLGLMGAPSGHFIHSASEGYRDGNGVEEESRPDKPCLGYILERTWSVMFNCSGLDVMERLPCPNRTCVGPQCIDDQIYPVPGDLTKPRSNCYPRRTL